jgi:hypothetical protein
VLRPVSRGSLHPPAHPSPGFLPATPFRSPPGGGKVPEMGNPTGGSRTLRELAKSKDNQTLGLPVFRSRSSHLPNPIRTPGRLTAQRPPFSAETRGTWDQPSIISRAPPPTNCPSVEGRRLPANPRHHPMPFVGEMPDPPDLADKPARLRTEWTNPPQGGDMPLRPALLQAICLPAKPARPSTQSEGNLISICLALRTDRHWGDEADSQRRDWPQSGPVLRPVLPS